MPDPQGVAPLNLRRKYEVGVDPNEFATLKKEGIDFTKPLSREDLENSRDDARDPNAPRWNYRDSSRSELPGGVTAAILKDPVFSKLAGATGALRLPRADNIFPGLPSSRGLPFPTPSKDGNVYFAVDKNLNVSASTFPGLNDKDAGSKARAEAVRALAAELREKLDLNPNLARKVALKAVFIESPHAGTPNGISIPKDIYESVIAPRVMEIRLEELRVARLPQSFSATGSEFRSAAIRYGAMRTINEAMPFDATTNTIDISKVTGKAGFDKLFHTIAKESLTVRLASTPFHGRDVVSADTLLNDEKLIKNIALKGGNPTDLLSSYNSFKDLLSRAEKLKLTNTELYHALSSEKFSVEEFGKKIELLEKNPSKIELIRVECGKANGVGHRWLAAEAADLWRFLGEDYQKLPLTAIGVNDKIVYQNYLESSAFKTALSKNIEGFASAKNPAERAHAITMLESDLRGELSELYRNLHSKEIAPGQLDAICKGLSDKMNQSASLIAELTAKGVKPNEIVLLLLESGGKSGDFVTTAGKIVAGETEGVAALESLRKRVNHAELMEQLNSGSRRTPTPKAAIPIGAAFGCFHEFMTGEFRKTESLLPGTLELVNAGSRYLTGYGIEGATYRRENMLPWENYAISGVKTGFDAWLFTRGMHTAERTLVRLGAEASAATKIVGKTVGAAGVGFVGVEGFMTQRGIPLESSHNREASWSASETVLTGAAAGSFFGPVGTVVGGGVGAVGSFTGAVTGYYDEVLRGETSRARHYSVESLDRGVHGFVFSGAKRDNTDEGRAIANRMAATAFKESIIATFKPSADFKDRFDFAAYEKFASVVAKGGNYSTLANELKDYGLTISAEDSQKLMECYYNSKELIGKVLDVEGHSYQFTYVEDEGEQKVRAGRGVYTIEKCERLEKLNARFKAIASEQTDTGSKLERMDNLLAVELPMLREIVGNEKLFGILSNLAPDIAKSDFVKAIQKDLKADRP